MAPDEALIAFARKADVFREEEGIDTMEGRGDSSVKVAMSAC